MHAQDLKYHLHRKVIQVSDANRNGDGADPLSPD